MIISHTGHRPNKLPGGYDYAHPFYIALRTKLKELYLELKPDKAISGVAVGFDTIAAETCLEVNIPLIAAVPFVGQENIWKEEAKKRYKEILSKAEKVHIVCPGGYAAWKMQARNEFMNKNADVIIALWDGTTGGTYNCVENAKSLNKKIIIIDPKEIKY